MKKDLIKFGLETIAFQPKNFGKELELILESIRTKNEPLTKNPSKELKIYLELIQKCIEYHTGLVITIVLNDFDANANLLPIIRTNHILLTESQLKEITKSEKILFKNLGSLKADFTFNRKTGKIGTNLKSINNTILLSYKDFLLNRKFTIREVVGVLLHEVGHGVVAVEYMSNIIRTNQALATVYNENFVNDTPEVVKIKLRTISNYLDEPENSLDELAKIPNLTKETIATVIVDKFLVNKKSELGTSYYDAVSFEYLADQYSARFGYGPDLISLLQKTAGFFSGEKNIYSNVITKILELKLIAVIAAFSIYAVPIVPLIVTVLGYGFLAGRHVPEGKYDNLKTRVLRLKEQVIQNIKLLHLSNQELKELLTEYDKIEKIVDSIKINESYINRIITFFSSVRKEAKDAIMLQRDLEELASNKLFVQSAKLKTMS